MRKFKNKDTGNCRRRLFLGGLALSIAGLLQACGGSSGSGGEITTAAKAGDLGASVGISMTTDSNASAHSSGAASPDLSTPASASAPTNAATTAPANTPATATSNAPAAGPGPC